LFFSGCLYELMDLILVARNCCIEAAAVLALPMRWALAKARDAHIVYDADAASHALNDWFEPDALARHGWLIESAAAGRGRVHFFSYNGREYVLRHYYRGGRAAALLDDRYLWTGLEHTRAWREWSLLARLAPLNLPAPRPFAARVVRCGLFYRADLVTERIANASSIVARLATGTLPKSAWREVGRVIARFHAAGVWHADLNANNVLLSADGAATLIDFDRACFRPRSAGWQEANLARLLRSLRKLTRLNPGSRFSESDYALIREGYGSPAHS
jgi:3-deoxy-D-manno-octulosonic acid kinase